jgi:hypothetical protein
MSSIDRDLAREGALRARFRRAGCPDPKCVSCGEERIWRLVFKRYTGRNNKEWPLCCNCYADRTRNSVDEAAMRERFIRAGFHDPKCVVCVDNCIWRLELDHIASQKHDPTTAPLCGNCHADRTFAQSLEPAGGDNPKNVFEVIGRWLLGIAEWFELIVEKLYEFGEFLIDLAKKGYGGDLTFP